MLGFKNKKKKAFEEEFSEELIDNNKELNAENNEKTEGIDIPNQAKEDNKEENSLQNDEVDEFLSENNSEEQEQEQETKEKETENEDNTEFEFKKFDNKEELLEIKENIKEDEPQSESLLTEDDEEKNEPDEININENETENDKINSEFIKEDYENDFPDDKAENEEVNLKEEMTEKNMDDENSGIKLKTFNDVAESLKNEDNFDNIKEKNEEAKDLSMNQKDEETAFASEEPENMFSQDERYFNENKEEELPDYQETSDKFEEILEEKEKEKEEEKNERKIKEEEIIKKISEQNNYLYIDNDNDNDNDDDMDDKETSEYEINVKKNNVIKKQSNKNNRNIKLGETINRHDIFFTAKTTKMDFNDILKDAQEFMAKNYSSLMVNEQTKETRRQIKTFLQKYILERQISAEGMTRQELIDKLYTEMAEYGFLTKYIFGKGIEEIDINAWDDIEVQYSDGRTIKLEEHFDSPEHAINIVRRMLHFSGIILDNASPSALGHLSKNIRIAALKTPLVDEDVGVAASIRIVNPQNLSKEDFIEKGTATEDMLDFLSNIIKYGVSVCVAGATSSGKTTMLGWLLSTIPEDKRIYTIENGSRELNLVKHEDGKVVNSVIHTLTRHSENDKQSIDQIDLLDMALRFNPDIAVVGEMRGEEANAAQEAARTGIAVLTTIHANSCEATYRRMVSLCKRAVDMSDETLMSYVTEAYPIIVFCKQLENKERKLMEIMECEILPDGKRVYRPIYQYVIQENLIGVNGKALIKGYHEQQNNISASLEKRLLENGMPRNIIKNFRIKEG